MKADQHAAIDGNIEALDQGIAILNQLTDAQYIYVVTPYVQSSIGQHIRHIVDIFQALINGLELGHINYDTRSRGSNIETHRVVGLMALQAIKDRFVQTKKNPQFTYTNQPLNILTEVQLSQQRAVELESNFIRECVFTCSHAVHHYALINVIAKLQDVILDKNIGIAPATASYLRVASLPANESFSSLTSDNTNTALDKQAN